MLHVSKQQKGDTMCLTFAGSIDETVDFSTMIGVPQHGSVEVYLKEITRLNSLGVKAWMKYFKILVDKGIRVKLMDCSTAIVDRLNTILNFSCGASIETIYVPYVCKSCKKELLGLFKTGDLKKLNFKVPDLNCPRCKGAATFDDYPQEYFGFLHRK